MEKIINSYETLFIIDPDLTEEANKTMVEKFTKLITSNGGEIEDTNEWGKRKLAYPINDKPEGYYVLINFKSESSLPSELERIFGITEGILRSIVIRHEDTKKSAGTVKTAPAVIEPEEEEAPAAEPVVEAVKEAAEETAEEAAE
jgi:small subunit ribosomal protein S6